MIFIKDNLSSCNNEEKMYAMQQKNLVYNGNFLYFSNMKVISGSVEYGHPDGWIYEDTGANAQIYLNNENCIIVVNNEHKEMTFKQSLHEFPRWKTKLIGQTITLEACISLSADN